MTSLITTPPDSRGSSRALILQGLLLSSILLSGSANSAATGQKAMSNPTWVVTDPKTVGWSRGGLERAAKYAQGQGSTGLVVVVDGKKILDRSWPAEKVKERRSRSRSEPIDGRAVEDVASVQKSVVAFLVGMAEKKGLVDTNASVSQLIGDGWSRADVEMEQEITVRHLLTMTSGLSRELAWEAKPGTKWRYNTGAYANLREVLEKVAGMPIEALTEEWLTGPLSMVNTSWRSRGFGSRVISKLGLNTTAEDLARFGGLILDSGVLGGEPLVTDEYFAAMLSSSQTLNLAYGYLWWLNGKSKGLRSTGRRSSGPLIGSAPKDLVAATGALDRRVYVVASLKMVVTRLGAKTEARDFDQRLWELLLLAAP